MKMIIEEGIDGYIADRMMRKRDPRFQDRDRFKERAWVDSPNPVTSFGAAGFLAS